MIEQFLLGRKFCLRFITATPCSWHQNSIMQKLLVLLLYCCSLLLFSKNAQAKIVFASNRDRNYEIYAMDDNGINIQRITENSTRDSTPFWSSDGSQIVFSRLMHSPSRKQNDLFIIKMDGGDEQRLTNHPAIDVPPSWSPDRKRIAFTSNRSGNAQIHVMDLTNGKIEQLTNSVGISAGPDWSPDGKQIVYQYIHPKNGQAIYIMSSDGTKQKPIHPVISPEKILVFRYSPKWFPDGKKILFCEMRYNQLSPKALKITACRFVVRHKDIDTEQIIELPTTYVLQSACWMYNGEKILFAAKRKPENFQIYIYHMASKKFTNLTNHPTSQNISPHWVNGFLDAAPRIKRSDGN